MPTYDYECLEGHRFEVFQKMSDDPVAECPTCGKKAKRMISGGAGFLFKGEGFYITDYRSEDYRKKASAEPGASAAASGSSGSGSADSGGSADPGASSGSGGTGGGAEKASKDAGTGSTGSKSSSSSES